MGISSIIKDITLTCRHDRMYCTEKDAAFAQTCQVLYQDFEGSP